MNTLSRSLSLATLIVAVAATGAYAQNTNSNSPAGLQAPSYADAQYPAGYVDPALTSETPSKQASVPADENPTVAGATGSTIVPGDRSTISGDRKATLEQKSGFEGGDLGG